MTLRELTVVLGLKVNHEAFEALDKRVDSIKENFKHLAEIAIEQVAAVVELTRETAKSAEEAHKMGQAFGMSAQEFMKLKFAAEMSDVPIENMQTGLRFLAMNAVKASQGSAEASTAFARAGVSIYGGNGKLKSTSQLLMDISDRLSGMKDGIEKTALAGELLGARSGAKLIPFLDQGPEKLKAFADEAQNLGLVIDEQGVEASERLMESWKRIMGAVAGLRNVIGITLVPVLQKVIDQFMDWYKANRAILQQQLVEFFKEAATEAIQFVKTLVKMAGIAWTIVQALGGMDKVLRLVVAGFVAWTAASTIAGIIQLVKTVLMLKDAMVMLGVSEAIATGGLSLIAAGIGAAAVGTYMATSGLGDSSAVFGGGGGTIQPPKGWQAPGSGITPAGPVTNYTVVHDLRSNVSVDARGATGKDAADIGHAVRKALDEHLTATAAPAAGGVRR